MAQLYDILKVQSKYWDKKNFNSQQEYNQAIANSSTVYIGNLSFYTAQDSIKELFERVGTVKQIIMGIDNQGLPCGFCFVIYENRESAQLAVQYISRTKLGGRIIRVDWDPGYIQGRQKGRGTSGLQRRDDFRNKEDPQRPRKKVNTNEQSYRNNSNYKGDYNRDSHRDNRGGDRRDFKSRDQRNDYRNDYRKDNRQYRDNKQKDSQY